MKVIEMVEKGFHADEYLWIRDNNDNIVLDNSGNGCKLEYSEGFEELDSDTDYVVTESTWITCRNKSINIYSTEEGVVVDIYDVGYEDTDPVASTYSFF